MSDHTFCRTLLKLTMEEVRKVVPRAVIKEGWGYKYAIGGAEFQINRCEELPEGFFWSGDGCCLWNAKSNGWSEYLRKIDLEGKINALKR